MDATELARTASVPMGAVRELQTFANKARDGRRQFRHLIHHGREMRELLLEALLAYRSSRARTYSTSPNRQGLALDRLEALIAGPKAK